MNADIFCQQLSENTLSGTALITYQETTNGGDGGWCLC